MPQRFLSIKNFEKYNPNQSRTYPWIRLYKSILTDKAFLELDITSRYLYIGLLILASETNNHIPGDVSYLSHMLGLGFHSGSKPFHMGFTTVSHVVQSGSSMVSLLDLRPLYRSGLLQASKSTKWRSDKRRREEIRREEIARADQVACDPQPSRRLTGGASAQTDEDWLKSLKDNPAYAHLNLEQELGKMEAWLSTRPGKKKTRRFIVNWLNRVEKPVPLVTAMPAHRPAPVVQMLDDPPFVPTLSKEEAEATLKRLGLSSLAKL